MSGPGGSEKSPEPPGIPQLTPLESQSRHHRGTAAGLFTSTGPRPPTQHQKHKTTTWSQRGRRQLDQNTLADGSGALKNEGTRATSRFFNISSYRQLDGLDLDSWVFQEDNGLKHTKKTNIKVLERSDLYTNMVD
ncbi:hypothetical protein CRENBAI_005038 [Crenichthys baileyi]|uniref:Uncharacterized protein n=1 Tax=Crenichthys baileyi TaxID=28760 RepID=A0AAV9RV98_9TELE